MLVDDRPRRGSRNTRVAFVHPKTNHGVLVELVQAPNQGDVQHPDATFP
jgi:methylmalonyl-CoA/ethylmalonyl-CoA epimerase